MLEKYINDISEPSLMQYDISPQHMELEMIFLAFGWSKHFISWAFGYIYIVGLSLYSPHLKPQGH